MSFSDFYFSAAEGGCTTLENSLKTLPRLQFGIGTIKLYKIITIELNKISTIKPNKISTIKLNKIITIKPNKISINIKPNKISSGERRPVVDGGQW